MSDGRLVNLYEYVLMLDKCRTSYTVTLEAPTVGEILDCLEELGKFRKIEALGYKSSE